MLIIRYSYRLSLFGFPGNSPSSFNLGLLDHRLAVEWVRDNIAAFGGDPSRITLFGESAGGTSVDHYSYAWKNDPIVHALIVQSGNVARIGGRTAEQGRMFWLNASQAFGCGKCGNQSTHDQQIYDCMMTKPAGDIVSSSPRQHDGHDRQPALQPGPRRRPRLQQLHESPSGCRSHAYWDHRL